MIDIRIGNSLELVKELPDKSIDCVMTSPPYWGLRDYNTEPIQFDGFPDCEHDFSIEMTKEQSGGKGYKQDTVRGCHFDTVKTSFCSKCGAWRGQLGLEPTPEIYLKHLLDLFDDIRIKLKDEGNCFVNLGDTYNGTKQGNTDLKNSAVNSASFSKQKSDLPSKCLCMIPSRFAWGMIERDWILRNEIIWAKPNHMPESVTDRLTKSHEVIYHFVKQGKYYYDLDAIREPHKTESIERYGRSVQLGCNAVQGKILQRDEQGLGYPKHAPKWFIEGQNPESFGSPRARTQRKHQDGIDRNPADIADNGGNPNGKNPGDVWSINTQPYPESHFAVFPLELVRKPILAGCPPNGTVLDPFGGSGTVGEFCRHNERNAILFELNPKYISLIEDRSMSKIPELSSYLTA